MSEFGGPQGQGVWVKVPVPLPMTSGGSPPQQPAQAPAPPPRRPAGWTPPPLMIMPHTPTKMPRQAPVRMARSEDDGPVREKVDRFRGLVDRLARALPAWVPTETEGNEENTGFAPVQSSWIAGLRYTREGGTTMTVKKTGKNYSYPGFNLAMFRRWLQAKSKGKWWWANIGYPMRGQSRQSREGSPERMSSWGRWDPTPGAEQSHTLRDLAAGAKENPRDMAPLHVLTDAAIEHEHPKADLMLWYLQHGIKAFEHGYHNPTPPEQFNAFTDPWSFDDIRDEAQRATGGDQAANHLLNAAFHRLHTDPDVDHPAAHEGREDNFNHYHAVAARDSELHALGLNHGATAREKNHPEIIWSRINHIARAVTRHQTREERAQVDNPLVIDEFHRHARGIQEFGKSLRQHLGEPTVEPAKMARVRAPAGGSIVRGIYYVGGQALPAEGDGSVPGPNGKLARIVRMLAAKRRGPAT